MISYIIGWWRSRQRAIDVDILWPLCKQHGATIDHARAAFAVHAYNDPAWLCLGEDEIMQRIGKLA